MSKDRQGDDETSAPVMVAITASAARTGSLEALLGRLPPQPDAAIVVVLQHMEALDEDRFLGAARAGGHVPQRIADGIAVEPGRLYLNPQDMIVTVEDGRFGVQPTAQAPALQGIIDSFLVSLAHDLRERAIGVALDGTDGDGTLGARELKASGGMVLAECVDENLAHSNSAAALADAVLPVEDIAPRLLSLIEQAARLQEGFQEGPGRPQTREALRAISGLLRQKTGHDFHGYKTGTFLRRVHRRMQALLIDDLAAYVELLRTSNDEAQNLFNDLLIGVTEFFRDRKEWDLLEQEVIPRLFEGKGPKSPLRVWVVGCSTGEEAYSLAILLAEHRSRMEDPPPVQIFASDLDGRALAAGRAGRYPDSISTQLPPERLGRWFVKEGDTYCVVKELREMCIFSQHSLIKDAPFSRLDLVSCRNLLIYLDADLQEKVIPLFHFALNPGGFLFLGNSENASRHQNLFTPVEARSRIFRRLDTSARVFPDFPFTSVDRNWVAHGGHSAPDRRAPVARDLTRWAEHVMERHTPAFVVIDEGYTVLHFSGPMGRYLAPATGAASLDLLQLAHPVLRAELRTALVQAAEKSASVEVSGLEIGTNGQRLRVDMIVEPRLSVPESQPGFVVIFKDCGPSADHGAAADDGPGRRDEHVRRLEEDLRLTRDRLQATIEELESTNEELKSSNEEYQSLNEELQSANEELETSKEELQSVNEELTTVNGELAHRVQELGRANSDLKNFLESTQIATLFLDSELRVTNFTPAIVDVFPLVESDEGRPIEHIKARVAYESLAEDARRVLRTLTPVEREIDNPETHARYVARVLPYRSTDNYIAGVVVTFVDVTAHREALAALRESEAKYRSVFSTIDEGFSIIEMIDDARGKPIDYRFVEVNPAFERHTGLADVLGKRVSDLIPGTEPYWIDTYGLVALTGEARRFENYHEATGRWYDVYASRVEGAEKHRVCIVFNDITVRKRAEASLRESEFRQAFLLKLSDALRPLSDPAAIQETASRLTAEHLGIGRVGYCEISYEPEIVVRVEHDWPQNDMPTVAPGLYRMDDFGHFLAQALTSGRPAVMADATTDPRISQAERDNWKQFEIVANCAVPVMKEGRFVAYLVAQDNRPRDWTEAEIALLREVSERVWTTVERARAEARLRESEARFRTLVDVLEDVFYITDLEHGALEYLSPAYERIWGRPRSEIMGNLDVFAESIHPEDRAGLVQGKAAQARGEPVVTRYRILRPDGETRHILDRSFPVPGAGLRAAGVASDVTAVTRAESRLRETEARLMAFGEASSDLLWIRNAQTLAFEYVSPAFERIYGASRDEVLEGDTLLNWLEMIVPEDRTRVCEAIEKLRGGERLAFDYRITRPSDGQVRLLRDTGFPIRDPDRQVLWIAGVGHDASEERASAERLKVLVGELQHRTRNLLGVVRSLMEQTLQGSTSLEDFNARIHERLGALARVNGLLSRLQEDDRVDFDTLIRSELDAHGVMDGGQGGQVSLHGPEGVRLRSSTVQMLALGLHELATNALKYGALSQPEGHLDVGWSLVGEAGAPRWLQVEWIESGVTLAPAEEGMGQGARRRGYGRELIEQALPYQLNARVVYQLTPQGVRCTITLPLSSSMDETGAEGALADD